MATTSVYPLELAEINREQRRVARLLNQPAPPPLPTGRRRRIYDPVVGLDREGDHNLEQSSTSRNRLDDSDDAGASWRWPAHRLPGASSVRRSYGDIRELRDVRRIEYTKYLLDRQTVVEVLDMSPTDDDDDNDDRRVQLPNIFTSGDSKTARSGKQREVVKRAHKRTSRRSRKSLAATSPQPPPAPPPSSFAHHRRSTSKSESLKTVRGLERLHGASRRRGVDWCIQCGTNEVEADDEVAVTSCTSSLSDVSALLRSLLSSATSVRRDLSAKHSGSRVSASNEETRSGSRRLLYSPEPTADVNNRTNDVQVELRDLDESVYLEKEMPQYEMNFSSEEKEDGGEGGEETNCTKLPPIPSTKSHLSTTENMMYRSWDFGEISRAFVFSYFELPPV